MSDMFVKSLNRMRYTLCSTIIMFLAVSSFAFAVARPSQASTVTSLNTNDAYERASYRLPANSVHTFTRYFRRGETISVSVDGDTTTDLDVYVYDPFGRRVATDDDYTDQCYVDFNAYVTGAYTIRVVNRGQVYNDYNITFDRS